MEGKAAYPENRGIRFLVQAREYLFECALRARQSINSIEKDQKRR